MTEPGVKKKLGFFQQQVDSVQLKKYKNERVVIIYYVLSVARLCMMCFICIIYLIVVIIIEGRFYYFYFSHEENKGSRILVSNFTQIANDREAESGLNPNYLPEPVNHKDHSHYL